MQHASFDDFLSKGKSALAKGPIAMIFVEDGQEVESTIRHHLGLGFAAVLVFLPQAIALPQVESPKVQLIRYDVHAPQALPRAVAQVMRAVPVGTWLYYGYNAEYLFYPFCESRTVGELLAFHAEERRGAMLAYVIDLYAKDLKAAPSGVCTQSAMLDAAGYYALNRMDAQSNWRERQYEFFGGLRWRFEEFLPEERRKIDRIALFRASPTLALDESYLLSEPELNTYACPWHNNLTATICSFRAAKALKANPSSTDAIQDFSWFKSVPFAWHSQQLMDLGLMEPGQWF